MLDWSMLARAFTRYRHLGYQEVEVPWIVNPREAYATTEVREVLTLQGGRVLCGSGEQGLLMIRDKLKPGKYVTMTPCFRKEEQLREGHTCEQFMKIELMRVLPFKDWVGADWWVKTVMQDACKVMYGEAGSIPDVVPTKDGYDLEIAGVEVGSYGVRDYEGFRWVYGTGLAEPRFSYALTKVHKCSSQ